MINPKRKNISKILSVFVGLMLNPILSAAGTPTRSQEQELFYVKDHEGQHFIFKLEDDVYAITRKTKTREKQAITPTDTTPGLKEVTLEFFAGEQPWIKWSVIEEENKTYSLKHERKRVGISLGLLKGPGGLALNEIIGKIIQKVELIINKNPESVGIYIDQLKLKSPGLDKIPGIDIKIKVKGNATPPPQWLWENGNELNESLQNQLPKYFEPPTIQEIEEKPEEPIIEIELVEYPAGKGKKNEEQLSLIREIIKKENHNTFPGWSSAFKLPDYKLEKKKKKEEVLNELIRSAGEKGPVKFIKNYLSKVDPMVFLITAVIIAVLILLIFPWWLYTRVIKRNNREIGKRLLEVEENFFKFEAPAAALKRISGIIAAIKQRIKGKSIVPGIKLFKKKKGRQEKEKVINMLEEFEKHTKELVDLIERQNTETRSEIVKLHSHTRDSKKEVQKETAGDQRKDFDWESKPDKLFGEWIQLEREIDKLFRNNALPPHQEADIKRDTAKIQKIIDFVKSDYNKYNRITVRLQEIKNKFAAVLETQSKSLDEKNSKMEEMTSKLNTSTLSAVETFKKELNDMLKSQDNSFNTKKDQLTGIINELNRSTTGTISEFAAKFNQSLATQTDDFNRKKEKMETIITNLDNSRDNAITRIEKKSHQALENQTANFNKRENEFNHLVETQAKTFEENKKELSGVIDTFKTTTAAAVQQFESKFDRSLETQAAAIETNTNKLSGIINHLDNLTTTAVNTFKGELNQTLDTQRKEFYTLNSHFEAKGKEMVEAAAHRFENLKSEFTQLVEEQLQKLDQIGEAIVPNVKERFELFVENMRKNFDYGEINERYVDFLNKKMYLNISKETGPRVIERIAGEPKISEDYRSFAIDLFKLLMKLEKTHKNEWYWQLLLNPLKEKLDHLMLYFLNREGKSIYDSYYKNEEKWWNLKQVNEETLRHLINQEHWGQIWEPLLRWADFFSVYLTDHLDGVSIKLQSHSMDIKDLLENSLGYKIETYKPMQMIPKELIKINHIREISEHFTFFPKILPRIKDGKVLADAEKEYPHHPDKKIILYVDQLGLIDHGNRIREPKLIFYSPYTIQHCE